MKHNGSVVKAKDEVINVKVTNSENEDLGKICELMLDKISGKVVLNIYDAQGRLIQTKNTFKNSPQMQQTFNIKNLSAGVYNLQIVTETEKANLKFIKQK